MKKYIFILVILTLSLSSIANDFPFSKGKVEIHFNGTDDIVDIEYDLTSEKPYITFKGYSYPLNETQYSFDFPLVQQTATQVTFFAQYDQKLFDFVFFHSKKNTTNIKCENNAIGVGNYHKSYIEDGTLKHEMGARDTVCIYSKN